VAEAKALRRPRFLVGPRDLGSSKLRSSHKAASGAPDAHQGLRPLRGTDWEQAVELCGERRNRWRNKFYQGEGLRSASFPNTLFENAADESYRLIVEGSPRSEQKGRHQGLIEIVAAANWSKLVRLEDSSVCYDTPTADTASSTALWSWPLDTITPRFWRSWRP
jgi:hypothetical protein